MVHKGALPWGYLEELTEHFCAVNNCTETEFLEEKLRAGALQEERNQYKYQVRFGTYGRLTNQ